MLNRLEKVRHRENFLHHAKRQKYIDNRDNCCKVPVRGIHPSFKEGSRTNHPVPSLLSNDPLLVVSSLEFESERLEIDEIPSNIPRRRAPEAVDVSIFTGIMGTVGKILRYHTIPSSYCYAVAVR